MHISIDSTRRILAADPALREGLNVLGPLHGIANSRLELEPVSSEEELLRVSPVCIQASGPLAFVRSGKLEWIAPDITAAGDLFYAKQGQGNWLLADDFFWIAKQFSSLTFARSSFVYFVRHGFFPPGKSFCEEIPRVRMGTKLVFQDTGFREQNVWQEHDSTPRTYETFKRAFSSVFETYPFGEQAAVSLSAGSDSGLVAAVSSLKYAKRPLAVTTIMPNQPLRVNDIDAANVRRIAKHLGLEHAILEFDFNEHHAQELAGVVQAMPLAAHLSLHFFKIGEEVHKRGKVQFWHGQSADSVYNLGPTQRSWGGPLRRFYLTREYWQGFPDVSGNRLVGSIARALGALGPLAWERMHGQHLRQPASFQELMATFANSQEELPFPKRDAERIAAFEQERTPREAREEFFAWKAQSFLTGRDPRILYTVGERYGVESVLPYTAANMLAFFRGLEMSFRDVFAPKRFIYRYLEELLGKHAYKDLYKGQEKHVRVSSPLTWAQWQKSVLANTMFGQELREQAVASGLLQRFQAQADWNAGDLQHALGLYWAGAVWKQLERQDISLSITFV